jgi:hypothetical protein
MAVEHLLDLELEMFSPPEMMMSLERSLTSIVAVGMPTPRSPVWNQPPRRRRRWPSDSSR